MAIPIDNEKAEQKFVELGVRRSESGYWGWVVVTGTMVSSFICFFSDPNVIHNVINNLDRTSCFLGGAVAGGLVVLGTIARRVYLDGVEEHLNDLKVDQTETGEI